MKSKFLDKVLFNIIKSYKANMGDDLFLAELIEEDAVLSGNWKIEAEELREAFVEGSETKGRFAMPSAYLTPQHLQSFIKSILQDSPWLNDDWAIEDNVKVIAEMLELNRVETLILNMAVCFDYSSYEHRDVLEKIRFNDASKNPNKLYARLFDLPELEIKAIKDGFLLNSGFLTLENFLYEINDEVSSIFETSNLTKDSIEGHLFPNLIKTELSVENYKHLTKEIDICEKLVNRALQDKSNGINVMFWGEPGTGKTELAFVLANKNNWNLKVIGDISDTDQREKSRTQRMTNLKIAMKLFQNQKNVVLLFDEIEDLFKDEKNQNFSKAFINRIIETSKIPIIWTTNDLIRIGRPALRRMVYNIGFEVPPPSTRLHIWQTYDAKYELGLDEKTLENFADTYDMAPALLANAAKIAKLSQLNTVQIPEVLGSLDTLVNYGEKRRFDNNKFNDTPYDLSCLNADTDLVKLTDKLLVAKPQFSLCLYGHSGTGKSRYGFHLSKELKKKVLFKRASDLIDKYVGETEKNIADAFYEARMDDKILLIDEGDSFLQSREGASRSWEITQVNEMLSQMEDHTHPFILTTNLINNLDQAALRRFTFKIKFDFLKPTQAAKLFEMYFGKEAPKGILSNFILAPGDFATVKKRVNILDLDDADEIYGMLVQECELKPQNTKPMGFLS